MSVDDKDTSKHQYMRKMSPDTHAGSYSRGRSAVRSWTARNRDVKHNRSSSGHRSVCRKDEIEKTKSLAKQRLLKEQIESRQYINIVMKRTTNKRPDFECVKHDSDDMEESDTSDSDSDVESLTTSVKATDTEL